MRPETPADLAWCGLIGQEDMPGPMWTAICKENGWEDMIVRKGNGETRRAKIRMARAGHCAYPGCGRWVAEGVDRCTAGHAQSEHAPELEAIPF